MSETIENKDVKTNKKNIGCLVWIIVLLVVIVIPIIVGVIINNPNSSGRKQNNAQATMSDITGNWTNELLKSTFTFIPSCDIDGLELGFEIYDNDNTLLNRVIKQIGNVKEGQQYTVTITLDEYKTGTQIKTSVLRGTKKD